VVRLFTPTIDLIDKPGRSVGRRSFPARYIQGAGARFALVGGLHFSPALIETGRLEPNPNGMTPSVPRAVRSVDPHMDDRVAIFIASNMVGIDLTAFAVFTGRPGCRHRLVPAVDFLPISSPPFIRSSRKTLQGRGYLSISRAVFNRRTCGSQMSGSTLITTIDNIGHAGFQSGIHQQRVIQTGPCGGQAPHARAGRGLYGNRQGSGQKAYWKRRTMSNLPFKGFKKTGSPMSGWSALRQQSGFRTDFVWLTTKAGPRNPGRAMRLLLGN